MAKSTGKKAPSSRPAAKAAKPQASAKKVTSNGRASASNGRVSAKAAAPTRTVAAAVTAKRDALRKNGATAERSAPPSRPAKAAAPAAVSRSARSAKPPVAVESLPAPRPVVESVPTNDKPRKNQVGFSSKDLEFFRDLLLAKRRELVGDMSSMEREALRSGGSNLSTLPIHPADVGTDNYEQEFTLGLVEKDRQLLREINSALAKIQNGTYGVCEATGQPIGRPRLEAQPWARFSIEHARQLEKRGGRG